MNLFIMIDPYRRWRHVKITDRRRALDFAECMRELVDVHYPAAELIRVVMDNLSTHTLGALYEAFEPQEAHRILRRLEFHFVPKHGLWLNMAEIELGVLRGQCLDRRIEDVGLLRAEVAAWETQRNEAKATIEWTFTTEEAREKMGRAYLRDGRRPQGGRGDPREGLGRERTGLSVPSPADSLSPHQLGHPGAGPRPCCLRQRLGPRGNKELLLPETYGSEIDSEPTRLKRR